MKRYIYTWERGGFYPSLIINQHNKGRQFMRKYFVWFAL
jgi:hypothetical protein